MNGRWLFIMAWRDSHRNRARLFLFMASIISGIAALVAIYSFGYDLRRNVDGQAATLIGADLSISSGRPADGSVRSFLDSLGGTRSVREGDGSLAGADRSMELRFGSMILFPRTGGARLVQVRALKGDFPYYGSLETTPVKAGRDFRDRQAALVDKALMLQFNARVGDSIKVGNLTFVIAGVLDQAPGQTGISSSVAPIVYIPLSFMQATGLSQKGSRIEYDYYYKFRPGTDMEKLVSAIKPRLEKEDLRYETVETRKENTGRFFGDLTNFLSLVGFVALLLGCIGVASAIQIYIREKTPAIAVMRCLGVTSSRAFQIYLIQVVCIGLIGAVIGSVLGSVIQGLLPWVLKDFLPFTITTTLSWKAIGQGIALGVVISIVFGLEPLLGIRRIPPLFALRASFEPGRGMNDPVRWGVYALILLFIGGFTYLQLGEWWPTFFFSIGIIGAFLVLAGVARTLMGAIRLVIRNSWSYLVRQGFTNLYRPNNQTVILVVAIGLSTALICILFFVQGIVVRQLTLLGGNNQSNMILFDIQTSQERGVDSLTRVMGLPLLEKVPIVTVRMSSINGRTQGDYLKDSTGSRDGGGNGAAGRDGGGNREGRVSPRAFNEELRVTYRATLSKSERITEGTWTGRVSSPGRAAGQPVSPGQTAGQPVNPGQADPPGQPGAPGQPIPVSLEDGYARHIGVHVGDHLVYNVQGMDIPVVVGSLRKVQWNRMQTNFRVIFPTGVLESAPQFHVLLTHTPSTEVSARYQQAVVRTFPNVSIIDLGLILSVLDELLDKINYVIHFMAAFSVVTGLIVLIASVRNSKYQRIQESVLLRTLGAGRRQILTITALEYAFLGALAALTGILIALAGSWLLAKYLFKLPFSVDVLPAGLLFAGVSLLTLLVGLLNSRGVLNRPTLEILRTEV
jgi:putative ABC transport system permease protein